MGVIAALFLLTFIGVVVGLPLLNNTAARSLPEAVDPKGGPSGDPVAVPIDRI